MNLPTHKNTTKELEGNLSCSRSAVNSNNSMKLDNQGGCSDSGTALCTGRIRKPGWTASVSVRAPSCGRVKGAGAGAKPMQTAAEGS